MEIAFAEIARLTAEAARPTGDEPRPWLVDRALRHLLTDLTGNTHRAEFCIDKLYSPDSSRGRLGLLELRGFEMPPHPQMALVQALLVRSLVAMFWERPLHRAAGALGHRPARGLPAAAGRDPRHRRGRRRPAGARHRRSRSPGSTRSPSSASRGSASRRRRPTVELELRQAIEPWHVLGEEATGGGTARYVDSLGRAAAGRRSAGVDPRRHLVTCQGVPVPLTPTGLPGELLRRRPLPRLAAVVGPAPVDRGARAAALRRRRHAAPASASAARPTTSCTPAAAATTPRRSTPTRPRPGGPAASRRAGTPPAGSTWPRCGEAGRRAASAGLPAHARPAARAAAVSPSA